MKKKIMDKLFLLIDYIYPKYFVKKVRKEQIQILYKQLTKFILLSEGLVATGLVVALWNISHHPTLIYWLLFMYLFPGISRALLLIIYQKNKEKKSYYFWLNLFCLGVFFSAIGWGSVSIFILPDRETIYQFIGIMIIFGVTAAANNLYSPIFIVYTFFLILSFLPLSIWFFLQGDLYYLLSLMSLLYIGVMLSIAYNSHTLLLALFFQNDKVKKKSEELKNSLVATKAILESTNDGILVVNSNKKLEYYNQRFLDIWKLNREFVDSHSDDEAVAEAIKQLKDPEEFLNRLNYFATYPNLDSFDELSFLDGKIFERYGKPLILEGKILGRVWTFHEVTDRRKMEEQIIFQAMHDTLTGLPNRSQLTRKLHQEIKYAKRFKLNLAILFIDLDNFKSINDNLGHDAGDILLRQVAKRLVLCLRETDTVFRFGGDEFVVFCLIQNPEEIVDLVQKMHACLLNPVKIGINNVIITVSMGISIYPKHGKDPSNLLKNADIAMYWAKKQGRNSYEVYRKELRIGSKRRMTLLNQLHFAIERKQFSLVYQPIIDLSNEQICSLEVLLRWNHPKMGNISPREFIPLAEENGLIIHIGEWVLKEACKQAKIWQKAGLKSVQVAVNVSGIQISKQTFFSTLEHILEEANLEPKYLTIELTESTLMSNQQTISATLNQLRKIGVEISIDDFGTGYSSFAYLKDFSIDKIKIDKSFILNCSASNCISIIKAIIAMGKNLNLSTVAEGVETREQLNFLKSQGCDEIQGFLYSPPIPASEVPAIMNITLSNMIEKKGLIDS